MVLWYKHAHNIVVLGEDRIMDEIKSNQILYLDT